MAAAFQRTDTNGSGRLDRDEIRTMLLREKVGRVCDSQITAQAELMTNHLAGPSGSVSYNEFRQKVTALAERRDPRIWPITGTMLVAGTAVGVVLPVMPMLVHDLGLSQAEYGYVVSAFGLSKLVGNVPAAAAVDRVGRRAMLAAGLGVVGFGMAGIGLAHSLEHLVMARLLSGLGVSALLAGATMSVADISTPLNRARMMAPMMTAFSAGTVLGPALGGVLAGNLGIPATFGCVGVLFGVNAIATRLLTHETMPALAAKGSELDGSTNRLLDDQSTPPSTVLGSVYATLGQWRPLLMHRELRPLLLLNGAYWVSLAGANMTLLPLVLASDRFALSPAEVGMCFALQSLISVMGAAPSASLADRVGPANVISPALAVTASAMMAFPFAESLPQALAVLCVWAAGGTILGSAPTAHATNLVAPASRAQALALMRTVGDLGLFVGASAVGGAATLYGSDAAMQGTSLFLFASAGGFFVLRSMAARR